MDRIPAKWKKLFKLLPGYDPIATAGDCTFDAKVADRVCAFFPEYMTHIEGEFSGKPFELQKWQQALIGCAFGWKRPNGLRRYREVFQYVPRKNGKTTMIGALINLVAFCDQEPGAQIYSAAADREQAALVYRQTKGMIHNKPELEGLVQVYTSYKSISYPDNIVYKALSADAETKHGYNTHFCVIDELHAQPNRDLVDVLTTSTGSRRQPLIWYITTSDFDRESICNEKLDYAKKVQAGIIEDSSFLPCVFEASNDDNWESPKVWKKANPNYGISISEEYLRRECQRAKDMPTYLNTFKRLHLNIKTTSDVAWLTMDKWDKCGEKFDPSTLEGRECFAGLDLSTTTDVSSFVLVFPPRTEAEGVYILPFFWIPGDSAERREKRDRVPYITWARDGLMTMTEGNVVDYRVLRRQINELAERFNIREIAADRWNATQLLTDLMDDGHEVIQYGQGYRDMSAPTKDLEALVMSGRLRHGGNKVLRWMASNVMLETDAAGNIKPSKKKSSEKIDGIVSTVMALGRMNVDDGIPKVGEMLGFI